jgi:hypothetical protein
VAKKTLGDCIGDARAILQDTESGSYRYSDDELVSLFNNALYELKRVRPDLYIGGYGSDLTTYTPSDFSTAVPFSMLVFQPVVLFIAGMAELRDDEFTVDNRAGILLRAFTTQLSLPGGMA